MTAFRIRPYLIALLLAAVLLLALFALSPSFAHAQAGSTPPGANVNLTTIAGAQQNQTSGTCSLWDGFSFEGCVWYPLMSLLGAFFLSIGGAFLRLAGTIFDTLMYYVIINFAGTLNLLGITDAINYGWTVFRDFSNIVIIGLFVFIAISIILGLKEFGQKKLIANALIVAVLINFSLLFTKLIIDTSNFTAYQIYKQMAGTGAAPGNPSQYDIAAGFMRPMGITSVWNTKAVTDQVAQNSQSGWLAFFFGIVGGIMLIAAGGVMLYGSFLIMARALLFIFLMLTAALAFATYLLPSLSKGEYGWSAWWRALINNAVFAPLLTLFLAVSLVIMNAAGANTITPDKSLGAIIANPQTQLTTNAWTTILIYFIGIGLLLLSFRMASKFAGTVSGLKLGNVAFGAAVGTTLRGVGAPLRATLGRRSLGKAMKAEDSYKYHRAAAVETGDYTKALKKLEEKQKAERAAQRTFEPLDTKIGQILGRAVNVPESILKKTSSSYADTAKKAATEAVKEAAGLAYKKDEAKALAKDEINRSEDLAHVAVREQHKVAEEMHGAAQALAQSAKQGASHDQRRAADERELLEATQEKQRSVEQHNAGHTSADERDNVLREQNERIRRARERLRIIDQEERQIDTESGLAQAKTQLKAAKRELDAAIDKRAETILESTAELASDAAVHLARERRTGLDKAVDSVVGDEQIVQLTREKASGRIKNLEAFEKRKRQKEFDKELDEGKK